MDDSPGILEYLDEAILIIRKAAQDCSENQRREVLNRVSALLLKVREEIQKRPESSKKMETWLSSLMLLLKMTEILIRLLQCKLRLLKEQKLYMEGFLWKLAKTLRSSGLAPV